MRLGSARVLVDEVTAARVLVDEVAAARVWWVFRFGLFVYFSLAH